MKLNIKSQSFLMAIFVVILVLSCFRTVLAQTSGSFSVTGRFLVIWGDSLDGSSGATRYTLTEDSGQITLLLISETLARSSGGVNFLNGKNVTIEGYSASSLDGQSSADVLNVSSIVPVALAATQALDGVVAPAVSGSKPWVTIMCKFSDVADEPENLSFFEDMYLNVKPGLDHYWRELSYGTANVSGSSASGWFELPQPEIYYNPTNTLGGTDLYSLADDCIAAADASVDFGLYTGINMMFNTDFDNGYAWGGSRYMTLDGVTKVWSTTWEPPWAYADISVIAHEMGHGFGLPHSSGAYGQTYDNAWDVMSKDRYNCAAATDLTYGCMAQHTISYHKDKLGWIPPAQKYEATGISTITLDHLALLSTTNYRMAQIPINGSSTHFYTVEVRQLSGYDIKLPGKAVVIHEVDTTRSRPAYVVDIDLDGDTADEGAMWVVGETFTDVANGISVSVLSSTATGFQVSIVASGGSDKFPWILFYPAISKGL